MFASGQLKGKSRFNSTKGCGLNASLNSNQPLFESRSLGTAFFVLLLALVGVVTAAAQNSKTSGTLEGRISDTSGGLIPGVKVVLRQIETNQTRS